MDLLDASLPRPAGASLGLEHSLRSLAVLHPRGVAGKNRRSEQEGLVRSGKVPTARSWNGAKPRCLLPFFVFNGALLGNFMKPISTRGFSFSTYMDSCWIMRMEPWCPELGWGVDGACFSPHSGLSSTPLWGPTHHDHETFRRSPRH